MIKILKLTHYPEAGLPLVAPPGAFVLETCQRTLVLELTHFRPCPLMETTQDKFKKRPEIYYGPEAHLFLLLVVCGLKSRLQGEVEIMGQFKKAHQNYLLHPMRRPGLMQFLARVLQDAKKIRNDCKLVAPKSYAGMVRKILTQRLRQEQAPILILGSGDMAEKMIKGLIKRFPLTVTARNPEKLQELKEKYGVAILPWSERGRDLSKYQGIVSTLPGNIPALSIKTIAPWGASDSKRIFLDLGTPFHPLKTQLPAHYYGLDDLLNQSSTEDAAFQDSLRQARHLVRKIVTQRRFALQEKTVHSPTLVQASSF